MSKAPSPQVSILIPVFNAERYLFDCLESAARQSLGDIEIICIDDASTDKSKEIIRGFEVSDSRFRYLPHARNLGEGAARNTGINSACGRYVFHLDADDILPDGALEKLWRVATTHASQLVKGAYAELSYDGRIISDRLQAPAEPVVNISIRESNFLKQVPVGHWSYLYERAFVKQNEVRYRTDMTVGLDLVALSEALVSATRVSLLPDVVYHYRQTDDSATRRATGPETVRDGIKTKKLVSSNLFNAGYADAAVNILRRWDWQISAFWTNLSPATPEKALTDLFAYFREVIPGGVAPWTASSPLAHRCFLASILLGHDSDAIELLEELQRGDDFQASPSLGIWCSRVLELAPDDMEVRGYAEI